MTKFYIQDARNYVGDAVVWWGPDGNGYTTDLDEAGLYEEERARSIEKSRDTDKAIPEEVARAAAKIQTLVFAGPLFIALRKASESNSVATISSSETEG
jgi:hypothetical protein